MAVGYRNSAGVDYDDLFEVGAVTAAGYRRSDGSLLRYAARGSATKGPNVGARLADGVDLSNLWLPKGSAPPVPGFNGKGYSAGATAPTGATGTTSAQLRLTFLSSGTWTIEQSLQGNAGGSGTTTLESGTWLPSGQSASNYSVRYAAAGTGGTVTNDAVTSVSLATSRSFTLVVSVNSATLSLESADRNVTASLTRTGAGTSAASCAFSVEAQGQV